MYEWVFDNCLRPHVCCMCVRGYYLAQQPTFSILCQFKDELYCTVVFSYYADFDRPQIRLTLISSLMCTLFLFVDPFSLQNIDRYVA